MRIELRVPVKHVDGYQIWAVEASSVKEAIRELRDNGGEFVEEELIVTELRFEDVEALE